LSFRERLLFAWQIIWPLAALDFGWAVLLYLVIAKNESNLDSVYRLASFFLLAPWVVRRAFAFPYSGFRLEVLREGAPSRLDYQDSLKVMWLLSWRTAILTLAALVPLSLLLSAITDKPLAESARSLASTPFTNALALTVADLGSSFLLLPLVIPGMLRKQYRGFTLAARRGKR
jgi:hypothetical protein